MTAEQILNIRNLLVRNHFTPVDADEFVKQIDSPEPDTSNFATNADIKELRKDISELRKEIKDDLKSFRQDNRWTLGIIIGLLITLVIKSFF